MAYASKDGDEQEFSFAARDQYFSARPAAGFDDDRARDGAQPGAHRGRPDRRSTKARRWNSTCGSSRCRRARWSRGTVSAPTTGECARCLTPITGDVEIDLTELFAYPDSATEATTEADEVGHVVDDSVDLEQPIVDAVGLALPFSPLCGPDCQGLCPQLRHPDGHRRTRTTVTSRSTRAGRSSPSMLETDDK